ncbi:MAG TPA: phosphoglycerate dehydrogenase [Eubacteriaceae bacterium]|nr:phosphoglycerate dehydrogenase [Eubacteriaceae bacterium]
MKIVVVGDAFVDPLTLEKYAKNLKYEEPLDITRIQWGSADKKEFRQRAMNIELNGSTAEEYPKALDEAIKEADVLLTHFSPVPARLIEKAKRLKLIGTCRGGVEHIDLKAADEREIPVVHCIRNAEPVADFTLGLIYAETRNIARGNKDLKEGKWIKEFPNSKMTTTLKEQKVGLIGLGYIGKLVAKKLNGLGVEVWGYDPFVTEENLKDSGVDVKLKSIEEVFSQANILSLHLRLSEKTEKLVNARLLEMMQENAYLINTSRAGVVDKEALYRVLKSKSIAGAAIDVFWEEPIQADDPYLKLENVTLTPHIAGDTVDAIPLSPRLLVEEINKYLEDGNREMVVNLK